MARQKEYIEEEVIEKAMEVFWRNGYESTSVRMLEKEMGINQFSIYSSFGNKEGLFLKSLKFYRSRIEGIVEKLEMGSRGIEDIRDFFYDFLEFSKEDDLAKGCLMLNTINELGNSANTSIKAEIFNYSSDLLVIFMEKLSIDSDKDPGTIAKQANFLSISLIGLGTSSKVTDSTQLNDYIETVYNFLKN